MYCHYVSVDVTQHVLRTLNKERKARPSPSNASPSAEHRWSRLSARWIEMTPSRATSSTTAWSQRCSTTQISPSKTTQVGKTKFVVWFCWLQMRCCPLAVAAKPKLKKRGEKWGETALCVFVVLLMKVPLSQHPSEPLQPLQLQESSRQSSTKSQFQSDCLGAVASSLPSSMREEVEWLLNTLKCKDSL